MIASAEEHGPASWGLGGISEGRTVPEPRHRWMTWPDADNGHIAQRFRLSVVLHQLFHRTMLYAFARLRRGAIFGAGLLWFNTRIMPILANITGPSVSATRISASIAAIHAG
jgi:hypothetical protein